MGHGVGVIVVSRDRSRVVDAAGSPRTAFEHQQKAQRLFELAASRDSDAVDLAEENAESLMGLAKLRRQKWCGYANAGGALAR